MVLTVYLFPSPCGVGIASGVEYRTTERFLGKFPSPCGVGIASGVEYRTTERFLGKFPSP